LQYSPYLDQWQTRKAVSCFKKSNYKGKHYAKTHYRKDRKGKPKT